MDPTKHTDDKVIKYSYLSKALHILKQHVLFFYVKKKSSTYCFRICNILRSALTFTENKPQLTFSLLYFIVKEKQIVQKQDSFRKNKKRHYATSETKFRPVFSQNDTRPSY